MSPRLGGRPSRGGIGRTVWLLLLLAAFVLLLGMLSHYYETGHIEFPWE